MGLKQARRLSGNAQAINANPNKRARHSQIQIVHSFYFSWRIVPNQTQTEPNLHTKQTNPLTETYEAMETVFTASGISPLLAPPFSPACAAAAAAAKPKQQLLLLGRAEKVSPQLFRTAHLF